MKEMAIYALEMIVCSGVLMGVYTLLLDRQVKFRWCRNYLPTSLIIAAAIPALHIPVWPGPVIINTATAEQIEYTVEIIDQTSGTISPATICALIYGLGIAVMLVSMARQVILIIRLRIDAERIHTKHYTLIRTPRRITAFSFLRTIYVWSQTPAEELPAIIAHESSHIAHRHSAERIAMECLKAAMWWNPFAWLASQKLTEVEEYEADSDVLNSGYDPQNYMHILFRQLFGYTPEIANGLHNSLTKKRFAMMTTKTTGRYPLLRLTGALPTVIGLLCAFSFTTRAAVIAHQETAIPAAQNQMRIHDAGAESIELHNLSPGALYIVDGVEVAESSAIDRHQIANITIISDKSAIERYGQKGENGAIIISTKKATDNGVETVSTEDQKTPVDEKDYFIVAETMPTFHGGDLNVFRQWVQSQVKYPIEALDKGIQGRVVITFMVEQNGTVGDISIVQTPGKSLSDEVYRIVSSSPKWTPGQQRGQAVRVKYTLPIDFSFSKPQEPSGQK